MRNGGPLRSDALGCQSVQFISIHSKMRVQEIFYYIVMWTSLVILSSLSITGSRVLFIPVWRDSLRRSSFREKASPLSEEENVSWFQ